MVRAAAKNHAHVGVVVDPADYAVVLDELRADGALSRRDPAPPGPQGVRDHRRPTTPPSSPGSTRRRRGRAVPSTLDIRAERHRRTLRYGENPHQRAALYRTDGADPLVGRRHPARGRRALVPQPLRRRRRVAPRARPRRPAGRAPSSSTPTRAAWRSPTTLADAYQLAFECDPRSAFGGIVALNRPIDEATVEEMVAGRAGRRRDRARLRGRRGRRADGKRRNTRLLEARPPDARPAPRAADHRRLPRAGPAPLRGRPRTTGRSSPSATPTASRVGRRGAGLPHLRLGEVEQHRAGEGRRGRGASAPASRTGSRPARSRRRRPPAGPRAAPARATPSTRSPTASRPPRRPGWP